MSRLLEGKKVNLRMMEKEDVNFIVDIFSNIRSEDFDPILLMTRSEMMKRFDNPSPLESLTQNTLFVVGEERQSENWNRQTFHRATARRNGNWLHHCSAGKDERLWNRDRSDHGRLPVSFSKYRTNSNTMNDTLQNQIA